MEKEFLTIEELSKFLSIKKSTLYRIVENGELPHFKIGRLLRFRSSELDGWLESHKQEYGKGEKKGRGVLGRTNNPRRDIDRIIQGSIEAAKRRGHNNSNGKPSQVEGLRKEVANGTL